MNDYFDKEILSPDGVHHARLTCVGDILFGPPYYSLVVDGLSFGERIFGEKLVWSPDSTMLAVQEWLTIDFSQGPQTALLLVDLAGSREARVARIEKGFVLPREFALPTLHYAIDHDDGGARRNRALDLGSIDSWEPVSFVAAGN
jgi:hypothetical protein